MAATFTWVGRTAFGNAYKTIVVRVERLVQDAQYKKYVRRYARFMAHDEANSCRVGDRVRIVEHRPLSKRKRWRLQETLVTAERV